MWPPQSVGGVDAAAGHIGAENRIVTLSERIGEFGGVA